MKLFENVSVRGKVLPLAQARLFADFTAGWSLADVTAAQRRAILERGEACLTSPIPQLPASLYRQFGRIGNRIQFENAYFLRRTRLHDLLYAEAAEGQGRFHEAIVDLLWAVLEESTWVLPAHNPGQLTADFADEVHTVDLFSAATAGLLTLVLHLVGDRLDEGLDDQLLTRRLLHEIRRRVTVPVCRYEQVWMRQIPNNWNPWIFSNVLFCLTVCEEELAHREEMIGRILYLLDYFVDRYGESGGCDEGPSYWGVAGGSFFDCLELLYDLTGGRLDFFQHPFVRRMGEYIMKMHIHGDYFVTFADAPHKILSYDAMIARFGQRCGSEALRSFGLSRCGDRLPGEARLNCRDNAHTTPYRILKDTIFLAHAETGGAFSHALCHYLDDVQVMVARQSPCSAQGLFVAIKGGHNDESHNHNDVGTFTVYWQGEPFFVDAGVDTYSRTTFSPQRYTLWYMQSSYHNLPDLNGIAQRAGAQYRPAEVWFDPEQRQLSLELCSAYPEEAGCRSFRRTLSLDGEGVTVQDAFAFAGEARVAEHYLFQEQPDLTVPGVIALPSGPRIAYDPRLQPACEAVSLLTTVDLAQGQDPRGNMARNWGKDFLYRVTLSGVVAGQDTFRLRIDGEPVSFAAPASRG